MCRHGTKNMLQLMGVLSLGPYAGALLLNPTGDLLNLRILNSSYEDS